MRRLEKASAERGGRTEGDAVLEGVDKWSAFSGASMAVPDLAGLHVGGFGVGVGVNANAHLGRLVQRALAWDQVDFLVGHDHVVDVERKNARDGLC